MLMIQRGKVLPAALVFALCLTSTATAQGGYSPRVGIEPPHSERRLTPRTGLSREVADTLPADAWTALKYPLFGALIGAGVAFTVVYIGTPRQDVGDYSGNGYAYSILVPLGAVAGLIAGTAVYLVRRH